MTIVGFWFGSTQGSSDKSALMAGRGVMWPTILQSRAFAISAVLIAVFAAGFGTAWSWQGNKGRGRGRTGQVCFACDPGRICGVRWPSLRRQRNDSGTATGRMADEQVERDYQAIIEAIKSAGLIVLVLLSGCSARQPLPCPPPEIVRPVIPVSLLVPPPTEWSGRRWSDRLSRP